MARTWFKLMSEDGSALTSEASVDLDVQDVDIFRRGLKEMFKDTTYLEKIALSDLKVFVNGEELGSRDSLVGIDETKTLVVVVPKKRREVTIITTVDVPQVVWNIAPEPCPQLLVKENDQVIELPPSCVRGTGMGHPDHSIILYRRPSLVKQWNEMNRCSIQTYARLWVVGPPGTGKSCAALAFAWSLNRLRWDVIWIHYSRDDKSFNCVWLQGKKKAFCVVKERTIERDLAAILNTTVQTKKTIVFLDGYVKQSAAGEAALAECLYWHNQDKIKHRLVCVCSMVTVGKQYRCELYDPIPTNVDEDIRDYEMGDVEMLAGELHNVGQVQTSELHDATVHTQMLFQLTSWRFDEYEKAVLNDDFFCHVVAMFPPYPTQSDPKKEATERTKLLREKYFVAGGSARLMFQVTTATAIEALDQAIVETPNIETYLHGFVGDSSADAVNRLLARYVGSHGYDVRLVSEYVVRHFAMVMGPRLVHNFARACNVNPSVDGFILQACFFAQLSHNGLAWSVYVESVLQRHHWERSSIVFFYPDKYPIGILLERSKWMAPVKWNQGGYDAVFIDKAAKLVRFVQVMRVECHKFEPKYFVDLLNRLNAGNLTEVAVVELCFVVPTSTLEGYMLPVSKTYFKKSVVDVASSPSRATRSHPDQTLKGCSANVIVIGVDYEITNHHPVEGSQVG